MLSNNLFTCFTTVFIVTCSKLAPSKIFFTNFFKSSFCKGIIKKKFFNQISSVEKCMDFPWKISRAFPYLNVNDSWNWVVTLIYECENLRTHVYSWIEMLLQMQKIYHTAWNISSKIYHTAWNISSKYIILPGTFPVNISYCLEHFQ